MHPQELDNFAFKGIDFDALEKTQKEAIQSLCGENHDCVDFEPDWRFVIGLGGSSVYETSITLHHIYGIPYIPATSIKGVVRSWYLLDKYHDKKKEMEGYAIANDETFCKAFGCPKDLKIDGNIFKSILKHKDESAEFEGNIIFFDAFPLTSPKLKLDIMTPHYQPYYDDKKGEKPPADYYNPNPIPFLTVESTKFRIYYGVKKAKNKGLVATTKDWIEKTLTQKGIGAKTAVGYGYHKTENKTSIPKVSKIEASFIHTGILNANKRYKMEAIVTKSGKPNYVSVYVKEGFIQENVKLDVCNNPLDINNVIIVEVSVNKKGEVKQASYKGPKT
ncbi:MAG: hypothetical protein OHK0053_13990 [Microscillaceae bacterium]